MKPIATTTMLALASGAWHAVLGEDCHDWPYTCPGVVPRMPVSYQMNKSTIIMPCNYTGFTDPQSTLGWAVVDFDWSNKKGRGTADGWAKHKPMDDDELLMQQVSRKSH
jgi:hypothetical protein